MNTDRWDQDVANSLQTKLRRLAEGEFSALLHNQQARAHADRIRMLLQCAAEIGPDDITVLLDRDGVDIAQVLNVLAVMNRIRPSWMSLQHAQDAVQLFSEQAAVVRQIDEGLRRLRAKAHEFEEQAREADDSGDPEAAAAAHDRAASVRDRIAHKERRLCRESSALAVSRQGLCEALSEPFTIPLGARWRLSNRIQAVLGEPFMRSARVSAPNGGEAGSGFPRSIVHGVASAAVLSFILVSAFFDERKETSDVKLATIARRDVEEPAPPVVAPSVVREIAATETILKTQTPRCERGRDDGCRSLVRLIDRGVKVAAGHEHLMVTALRVLCDRGYGLHCAYLATAYAEGGYGLTKDRTRAVLLNARACNLDHGRGCNNLGVWMTKVNPTMAVALLWKACRLGYKSAGCSRMDNIDGYVHGYMNDGTFTLGDAVVKFSELVSVMPGEPEDWQIHVAAADDGLLDVQLRSDVKDAFQRKLRACQSGSADGCLWAAGMLRRGIQVEPDLPRAASLYKNSCAHGSGAACFMYASMMKNGEGMAANEVVATAHYLKSCDLTFGMGCYVVAQLGGESLSAQQTLSYHERGCRGGYEHSCKALGRSNAVP